MSIIATTNTEHYENIADSVRYSKDGTQYESDLVAAQAEIAEDDGYFSDISTAVQGKTGQVAPYDKSELAQAVDDLDIYQIPVDESSEVPMLVTGIDASGFYLSSTTSDQTEVLFGVDENNNLYVTEGSDA